MKCAKCYVNYYCQYNEFLIKYYVRKELHLKLGQILRADKTGFHRLGHI